MKKSESSSKSQEMPDSASEEGLTKSDVDASETLVSKDKDLTSELQDIYRHINRRLDLGESIDGQAFLQLYAQHADHLRPFLLELAAQGKRVYLKSKSGTEELQLASGVTIAKTIVSPATNSPTDNSQTLDLANPSALRSSDSKSVPTFCPSVRPPMAVLVMFFDGELGSTSYPLMSDRYTIGRKEGDLIISHEMWMSGKHAEIQRRKVGQNFRWFLVDQNSTNGSFVRIETVVLKSNDELFIGSERYRFFSTGSETGLIHITRGSAEKWVFKNSSEVIGSQTNSVIECMACDPYLDPIHSRISKNASGEWSISNSSSRNGLWFRIREFELYDRAQFQLGEQRFEFRCPSQAR